MDTPNDLEEIGAAKPAKKKVLLIAGLVILLLLMTAGFFYFDHQKREAQAEAERQSIISAQVFREGVSVNGVSVGGMTMEQAKAAAVESGRALLKAVSFSLTLGGESYPVTAEDLGLKFDTDSVLEQAFGLARDPESTLEQLRAELADIQENKRQYPLTAVPDEAAVNAFVASLAQKIDTPADDAQLQVLIDKNVSDEEKRSAAYVEAAATTTPERRFAFVPDRDGRAVDQAALAKTLLSMADTGAYQDAEIPVKTTKAGVTLADLQKKIVLRASSSTSYGHSPYNRATRVFNLKKAVGIINGTVVQPGEVFSYNDTVGRRTYAGGWKPAPAIVGGRTEDQAGGGVCQVSTTMYLSVLKADLGVVYRQGHSERLSYVDGGLDATVDSGRIDFQWKNTTGSPVYIFCWMDVKGKTIHFELYGEPFPQEFDEIRLSSKRVGTVPPPGPMQYVVDPALPLGVYIKRASGSVWQSYATYLKNGAAVKTVNVDRTAYKAYAGVTVVAAQTVAAPAAVVPVP